MGVSIEILVIKTANVSLEGLKLPFKTAVTLPAQSHRGSSSLWQSDFKRAGGTLVHIADPEMREDSGPFWAYEILEDIEWRRYRLLPRYKRAFFSLLDSLLHQSRLNSVLLTSDAQFGPKPLRYARPYSLAGVERLHDQSGLRLNSLMEII